MDQAGVATAILSIPSNGLWFPDQAENRRLARACNDYMASVVKDHPGRFGFWATLPLTDVQASLSEIKYAFDTLRADGINLFTVYGNKWLGDPAFEPVMAALNERKAVIYTHPTIGTCCSGLLPGIPPAVVEYGTDTSRTIASLLFTGVATKYSDIKFIFSHAGGTMPALLERYLWQGRQPTMAAALPNGILPPIRKFYYDVAQASNLNALSPLLRIVPLSQVLFGSDFPYRTCLEPVAGLAGSDFSMSQQSAIGRQNALPLVPRFA